MKPKRYSSKAIVLSRKKYSEADRIITLFTRDYGKVVVLAKGVRKPSSRKRGSLEVFSLISFSATRGKGLDIITESELIESFQLMRDDIKKVSVAYFFVEVVDKLVHEDEPHSDLFNLLAEYFDSLTKNDGLRRVRLRYIEDILILLGYWPRGKKMHDPDSELEKIVERELKTKRVGKIIQN